MHLQGQFTLSKYLQDNFLLSKTRENLFFLSRKDNFYLKIFVSIFNDLRNSLKLY